MSGGSAGDDDGVAGGIDAGCDLLGRGSGTKSARAGKADDGPEERGHAGGDSTGNFNWKGDVIFVARRPSLRPISLLLTLTS